MREDERVISAARGLERAMMRWDELDLVTHALPWSLCSFAAPCHVPGLQAATSDRHVERQRAQAERCYRHWCSGLIGLLEIGRAIADGPRSHAHSDG